MLPFAHRTQHNHTVSKGELGVGNLFIVTRHDHVPLEAERRAQPFDRGWSVYVAQSRNDFRALGSCFGCHYSFPLHLVFSLSAANDSDD